MTTKEFVKAVKALGFEVAWSNKNVSKGKEKILITEGSEILPKAWVYLNEQYSFRSLGVSSELFTLLVSFASTPVYERGII